MIVFAALVLALASPSPTPAPRHAPAAHARTHAPRAATPNPLARVLATPAPAATGNPFTLEPLPPTPLPVIGTTRSRALCTAMRRAVAPAVVAAMKTDATYGDFRKQLYDYTVYGTETSRDLKLMQMDQKVQSVVKTIDDLETALQSHAFDAPPNATAKDAETLAAMRRSMQAVLSSQKVQLDAMSGFVETERMTRFGRLSESETALKTATQPEQIRPNPQPGVTTEPTSRAFLNDSSQMIKIPPGKISLDTARKLDNDLSDLAAVTSKREDAATAVIVPATNLCK